jgi:CRP-like cAMP-binding protein
VRSSRPQQPPPNTPSPPPNAPSTAFDLLRATVPALWDRWDAYASLFEELTVPARATLLREGETSRRMFLVQSGCLRAVKETAGREVTFQFFFEGDFIASIESFRTSTPSAISIRSVEPSTLHVLRKRGFDTLLRDFPELKDFLVELAFRRFARYSQLFLEHLTLTPRERYRALLRDDPRIVARVPQKDIATYLGITPVSLSRIRKQL